MGPGKPNLKNFSKKRCIYCRNLAYWAKSVDRLPRGPMFKSLSRSYSFPTLPQRCCSGASAAQLFSPNHSKLFQSRDKGSWKNQNRSSIRRRRTDFWFKSFHTIAKKILTYFVRGSITVWLTCGKSYKHFMSLNYNTRVVIRAFFQSVRL